MAKILIIGGGAMGAAFTIPCLENNNNVVITEPYSDKFIKDLKSRNKFHSGLKMKLPKKIKIPNIWQRIISRKLSINSYCTEFTRSGSYRKRTRKF